MTRSGCGSGCRRKAGQIPRLEERRRAGVRGRWQEHFVGPKEPLDHLGADHGDPVRGLNLAAMLAQRRTFHCMPPCELATLGPSMGSELSSSDPLGPHGRAKPLPDRILEHWRNDLTVADQLMNCTTEPGMIGMWIVGGHCVYNVRRRLELRNLNGQPCRHSAVISLLAVIKAKECQAIGVHAQTLHRSTSFAASVSNSQRGGSCADDDVDVVTLRSASRNQPTNTEDFIITVRGDHQDGSVRSDPVMVVSTVDQCLPTA
jgi:hypothetical protein